MSAIIETKELTYAYPAEEDQTPVLALNGVDVAIEKGTFVVVLGHNGSGKSTLAKTFNGVLLPVLLVFMVLIASDKHVMGRYVNSRFWSALTWFTIGAVAVLTVVMFVMQALGV